MQERAQDALHDVGNLHAMILPLTMSHTKEARMIVRLVFVDPGSPGPDGAAVGELSVPLAHVPNVGEEVWLPAPDGTRCYRVRGVAWDWSNGPDLPACELKLA